MQFSRCCWGSVQCRIHRKRQSLASYWLLDKSGINQKMKLKKRWNQKILSEDKISVSIENISSILLLFYLYLALLFFLCHSQNPPLEGTILFRLKVHRDAEKRRSIEWIERRIFYFTKKNTWNEKIFYFTKKNTGNDRVRVDRCRPILALCIGFAVRPALKRK